MSRRWRLVALGSLLVVVVGLLGVVWKRGYLASTPLSRPRLARPYGMAPAAFAGFVRACDRAQVHPWRINQTIGDAVRSVGYHHRDGMVRWHGQDLDYTAAVDVGTWDLTRPQINRLLESMGAQGFAAFYREGPKWRLHEHIHAIYAPLAMKPQLRKQVRQWERARKRRGLKRYAWQTRWRRNFRA